MKAKTAVVAILGVLMGASMQGHAQELPCPEVTVPECRTAPVLDGDLKDGAWQEAARVATWHVYGEKDRVLTDTTAYVTRDNRWLYLAFDIAHPMPGEIRPKVTDRDGAVHSDDSVEIFLDPGTDGVMYHHLLVNVANVRAEQKAVRNKERDRKWDVPWRSATRITDRGWQVEIAIPLYLATSYGEPAKVRMNLAINRVLPVIDPQKVRVGEKRESAVWSPVYGSFHEPERFGWVKGLENAKVETPFLVMIRGSRVGKYYARENRYFYDVDAELLSVGPGSGTVRLSLTDKPTTGAGEVVRQETTIAGGKTSTVHLTVPVTDLVSRCSVLELADTGTGDVLQTLVLSDMEKLTLMSVLTDRNYYTSEPAATVVCRFDIPAEMLAGTSLVVQGPAGPIGRAAAVGPETRVEISLNGVASGTHTFGAELRNAKDTVMMRKDVTIIKRPPKPGLEYKIDRLNHVLLHDGKPFFPFGVFMGGIKPQDESAFQDVAAAGCPAIQFWNLYEDPANATAYYEAAARHQLQVSGRLECYATTNLTGLKGELLGQRQLTEQEWSARFTQEYLKQEPRILAGVEKIKDQPNLISYYSLDEPFGLQIEAGRRMYQKVHETDGYHPIVLLYSSYIPEGDEYIDWGDVLATDPYWVPGGDGVRGTVNFVAKITALTVRRAAKFGQGVWIVPVGERWSGMHQRTILPAEQRCQTYLALIHGAKGIFYFCYPFLNQVSYDALRAVAGEMRVLGPAMVSPEVPQTVRYSPGSFDPDKDEYPDVHACLRSNPEGGHVLLAANSRPYPVDVEYSVSLLGATGTVKRLFDAATYPVKNGTFADRLAPYDTRAYVLDGQAVLPVQVTVAAKGWPEQAEKIYTEPAVPRTGREGKKNLIPNPSFEVASVPGMPDYFTFGDYSGMGPRLGTPGARVAQDTTTAWHGKASLRLTGRDGKWKNWLSWWPGVSLYLSPRLDRPRQFTISAYMKADRPGLKAVFFPGVDGKPANPPDLPKVGYALTTEWTRYSETGLITPGKDLYGTFGVRVCGEGTVWVDALQLELGETPTAFEP